MFDSSYLLMIDISGLAWSVSMWGYLKSNYGWFALRVMSPANMLAWTAVGVCFSFVSNQLNFDFMIGIIWFEILLEWYYQRHGQSFANRMSDAVAKLRGD